MSDETNINGVVEALTDQQRIVLQAIYDYFRERAAWPKFITIDRPIRRERKWDTAAIVQGLPESVIVPPRHGNLRPVGDDELRLRLPGIEACDGGPEDTARFARLLRWIAEREEAYEPPADSGETMPLVTSAEAAQHLGLSLEDDRLSLLRLLALFRLDHWSASTGGPDESGGWTVRPGEDIWRFQDVQTVQDVVDARKAWIAEGRPTIPAADAPDDLTTDPPGQPLVRGIGNVPSSTPSAPAYIGQQVIDAIRAQDGQSRFDVNKLLALIDELNDNFAHKDTYGSHTCFVACWTTFPQSSVSGASIKSPATTVGRRPMRNT